MAIVGYLKKFESTFFNENVDLRRSCVNGILDEFFQRVWRTLDNFSSSNFINDLFKNILTSKKRE